MAELLTIVVTFNGKEWIERCLRSALESVVPTDVMVVDNGSGDGTPDLIKERFPDVILHENRENLGFAAANNIGFRHAIAHGYRFVYLLNQDAWVFPETFGTLLSAFGTGHVLGHGDKRLGILSPMQMEADLTRMDEQFRKNCAAALAKDTSEIVPVPFVMAAHWMVTRECLETTGGFSPAFPHYGEDNNFLQRAVFHGFLAAVVKTASAVHDRANRPRPKDYRMRLKVVTAKTAVADPRRNPDLALIGQSIMLTMQGIRHLSTIPWKGIRELWGSFDELKRFRKESKQRGAFL